MQEKQVIFPDEIYSEHLVTINGIRFTRREIDVMSCLLNAPGTSEIASLLSIALRTVVTHIRNIMLKLECNSREGIIDFIERSYKLSFLREYYAALTTEVAFEKSLKEVSKLKHEDSPHGLVIYWEDEKQKQILLTHVGGHLDSAGFMVEIKEYTDGNKRESTQDSYPISLLFVKKDLSSSYPHLKSLNSLDISEHTNYYFSVFEILKAFLPHAYLSKTFAAFQDYFGGRQDPSQEKMILEKGLEKRESKETSFLDKILQIFKNKKWSLGVGIICISFLIMGYWILRGKEEQLVASPSHQAASHRKDDSIRSDLVIPTEAVLLNRPELISEIDNKLKSQKGIQTIALVGPGGAGKTILSRQYAHEQKASVIWEVNAETIESLRISFESLAHVLAKTEEAKNTLRETQDIKDPEVRERKIILFVREQLLTHSNWLLVFDNVENFSGIQKYFPQDPVTWGQGKIVLTTRDSNIQNNTHVNAIIFIGELNANQKLNLFTKIINHGSNEALNIEAQVKEANAFLEHIPPFPLDVSVAAYYLKITNISYASYLESLRTHDKEFEEVQQNLLKEAGDYTKTRYSIITMSLKHLINTHRDFQDLLLFISLLDSQNIPRALLESYKDKAVVDNLIYHLKMYSLITNDFCSAAKNSMFSLHRSTQSVILAYLAETLNLKKDDSNFQQIIDTLEKYIFDIVHREDVLKMSLMLSHCERILKHDDLLTPSARALIKGELGTIYFYLNCYKEAEVLLQQAITVLKENKKNPNKLGQFLSCFASIYIGLGDGEKSIKYHTESVATFQKYFPDNYLKIALHLTYLGSVYRDIGEYKKSKSTLEEAHSIFKSKSLQNHSGFARNLVDLGKVYRSLGEYEKARVLQEQGLTLYKKHLPKNHFRIAWAAAYLANTLNDLEKFKEAQDLLEAAHQIYKNNFSDTHRRTAWLLASLGHSYEGLSQYKKAKELLEKSLKNLSESYFEVVWVLARLGNVCLKLGDVENAKGFFEKSLIILEKTYGKDHVETARVLKDLGRVYLVTGHIEIADNLINKAIRIFQNSNHPDLCFALEALAEMYVKKSTFKMREEGEKQSKDFKAQALNCLKQALDIVKTHFPKDSPHIARIEAKLKKLEGESL